MFRQKLASMRKNQNLGENVESGGTITILVPEDINKNRVKK